MEEKGLFKRINYDNSSQVNQHRIVLLDETYEKIEHVPGLKTELFLHQKTVIKAMSDLESNSILPFNSRKIRVAAGILSEPVGSGKTIDILSIILLQKNKLHRVIASTCNLTWFKKYKYVIKPTLIFVASSVIDQWELSITKFTDLSFFVVSDLSRLTKLIDIICDRTINEYDIILVKNGVVARLPYNYANVQENILDLSLEKVTPYIYDVISSISNICWSRVVIDDFDVIKLPKEAVVIHSSFTWYISSTIKNQHYRYDQPLHPLLNTTDVLLNHSASCFNILKIGHIYNNFNIRNTPEFIQKSNELSTPQYFLHSVPNKNNKIIKAISDLNIPELDIIADMLNADAIGDAAEKIGIKTTSVIDIFEHILGKQYALFKQSISVLEFIRKQKNRCISVLPAPPSGVSYKKSDLLHSIEIEYNYPGIILFLNKYEEQYLEIKKESSNIIERVRSNLQEGECPICVNDLNDEKEDIIIFKCCNAVICGKCCFSVIFKKDQYFSSCANCRSAINIKELVYLNNLDFDYDDLLDQFDEKNVDSIILENEPSETKEVIEVKKITKLSAIVDILKSQHDGKLIKTNIKNIMVGNNEIDTSNEKKVLIFGNYDSSLEELLSNINELKYKVLFLRGTHKQLSTISRDFTESKENCLLFINSVNYCSGLNLQSASELIFTHQITDPNIESQVIGRAQRLYRKSKLQIHYVVYENEVEKMNFSYIN